MRHRSRDTLVTLAGNAVAPAAALATAPILASGLGVVGRGEVAGATAPLLLAVSLASLGLPSAVNHWVARHPTLTRPLLGLGIATSVVVGAALTVAIVLTSRGFAAGDDDVARLIGLASIALVPNLVAALLQAVAAGRHAWRLVATERLLTNGLRLLGLGGAAAAGALTVDVAVAVIALAPVIGALVYLPLLRLRSTHERIVSPRVFVSYGLRVWLGALAGVVLTRLDQALLLPLAGATALGLYAVAVSLGDIPLVVANAVREVSFSRQSAETDATALARTARVTSAAVSLTCVAIALPLPWLVPTLFGAAFAPAIPVTLILLAGVAVGVPGSMAGVALAAAGRPGLRSTSLAVAALCNIGLLVALAGPLGVYGAALATIGGSVVSNGLNLVFAARTLHVDVRSFHGLRRSDTVVLRPLLDRVRCRPGRAR